MSKKAYTLVGTQENFETLVIQNSFKSTVLVHFWSPKAGPSMILKPVLTSVVQHYQGKLLLVEINILEQKSLVKKFNIRSIPYLKVFQHGSVIHDFRGGQSEIAFRRELDKTIIKNPHPLHIQAIERFNNGYVEEALSLLEAVSSDNPNNVKVRIDQVKLLLKLKKAEKAQAVIKKLPAEIKVKPEIRNLAAHIEFSIAAEGNMDDKTLAKKVSNSPEDLDARFQLSAVSLFNDDYETAMEQLLEITRRSREYKDDVGRNGLLALFDILGYENNLVKIFHSKMLDSMN